MDKQKWSVNRHTYLDSDSAITLQDGAVVQNDANGTGGPGNWGTGQNTIEFNNNTTLTVDRGAKVLAQGTPGSSAAIYIKGLQNRNINYGLIQSSNGPAILIGTGSSIYVGAIDNYGTISATTPENLVIDIPKNTMQLTNQTGGVIIGSIKANLVYLEAGSVLDSDSVEPGDATTDSVIGLIDGTESSLTAENILSARIVNFTYLVKDGDSTWKVTSPLSGLVKVTIFGGTLALTGHNSYTGSTTISKGTLAAEAANTFSPNSAYFMGSTDNMDLNGYNQTIFSMENRGTININNSGTGTVGTVLNVTGNYTVNRGRNGRLNFNAKLSDDASDSERLIVGGNTAGDKLVSVSNAGGSGAQTVDGIELISVGGSSDGVTIKESGAANIGELKLGMNGQLNKNFNLWGSMGQQVVIKATATPPACWG